MTNNKSNKFYTFISNVCKCISNTVKDKCLHFIISYIIFDFCLSALYRIDIPFIYNILISFVIVSVCIIGKEIIDEKVYNVFDIKDIIASYFGVIVKLISFIILAV